MLKRKKTILVLLTCTFIFVIVFSAVKHNKPNLKSETINTNATANLSNKKICWGIKREPNHIQPDVGANNKKILEQYNGICLGNSESKKIYLTFDSGYEAGYMEKILTVLKENNVKACFFITAHYLNTQPELIQKMIDDGHEIR